MDWICRFIILIDAHSPVYFAMALEIVLNRREDGLVRLSDTAAGYNTLAHLWLLPNFKTFSPSRFRYWGSNGFDYVCDTTEPTLHWTKEQMQRCSFCCAWHLKQCWSIERTVTWGTWGIGGIGWNWNVLSLGQISAILMDTHQSPPICFCHICIWKSDAFVVKT